MRSRLRALIVEDSPDDAELTKVELRHSYDPFCEVVDTQEAFVRALDRGEWDVVLCDHSLPGFDSLAVLAQLQAIGRDIPFIIVSGAIGEEVAVAAMKAGASDYVMKGNLARLVPAIEREIREAAVRREKRQAEMALLLSEARLAGLIDNAMDAIISIGADQRIVLFNKAAEAMFGYAAEEVLGDFVDLSPQPWHRDRRGTPLEIFGRTGMASRAMGDVIALTARRRSGDEFPVEVTISQVQVARERYFTVIIRDVAERMRAQEQMAASLREKEVLLREVHHRVKNNLQVVSSLLSLQMRGARDPAAVQALQDSHSRVRAMALVHERLHVAEDLARVDFGQYLRTFIPELVRLFRQEPGKVEVDIDAEDVQVSVDIAQPLALIANELVTNALKYAFPNRTNGAIHISADAPRGRGHSLLTVRDTGIGIQQDVIEQHASFGLRLVWSLAGQIGCTLHWDTGCGTTVSVVEGDGT